MNLLLTRHGQTPWNTQMRIQGRTDIPLSDIGHAQAARFAKRLASHRIDSIYTSPLSRAMETACILAQPHELSPISTPLMLERDFGSWEGLPYAELKERFPAQTAQWELNPAEYVPPGAEPLLDVLRRCEEFLAAIRQAHAYEETLLIVGHSVPLRLLLSTLIGLPTSKLHSIKLDNTSYTMLHLGRKRNTLLVLNDTSHMEDLS